MNNDKSKFLYNVSVVNDSAKANQASNLLDKLLKELLEDFPDFVEKIWMVTDYDFHSDRNNVIENLKYLFDEDIDINDRVHSIEIMLKTINSAQQNEHVFCLSEGFKVNAEKDFIESGKVVLSFVRIDKVANEYSKNSLESKTYIFDHEVGHALSHDRLKIKHMKNKSYGNYSESIADAYAALKHIQRFGTETKLPERLVNIRIKAAFNFCDLIHETSRAVREVIKLSKNTNIQKLSSREILDISMELGIKFSYTSDEEYNLLNSLRDCSEDLYMMKKPHRLYKHLNSLTDYTCKSNSNSFKNLTYGYLNSCVKKMKN